MNADRPHRIPFIPTAILVVLCAVVPAEAVDTGRQDVASADWWSRIQRSIQLEEYAAVDEGETGFRAVNRAHGFEGRFDSAGLRLESTEEATWTWGLSLTRWGRPGSMNAAAMRQIFTDANRIEFDRGSLAEWFVNSPDGLEHGFTIPARPHAAGDRLAIDLTVTGGLRPVFAADGQAIDFFGTGGISVLRYAKLVVTDTTGGVLPARMDPIAGGIRIVVEDPDAIYPITVDPLATSPSWAAEGEKEDSRYGISVATAGDVNGDGFSDVIVGAWKNTIAWDDSNWGKAYLYLGAANGLTANAAWTDEGETFGDRFGFSVATAGDVNGDGFSDVIIGAFGGAGFNGKAYLYLGGQPTASGLGTDPSWSAQGVAEWFGYSVATAGDVNGDGYSDVIIGGYAAENYNGRAHLYLGEPSVNGMGGLAATPSWTQTGIAEWFGYSVAAAGDVNGDGYSDVIVGAPANAGTAGKAYLYLGENSSFGLATIPSWTDVGGIAGDEFGRSVATAGDVNGDGYSDVIVGAFGNAGNKGEVYVYLGGQPTPSGLEATPSWAEAGEVAGDNFGISVATAGDVNGDGYADVMIGANGNDEAGTEAGKAYVYLGGAPTASGLPVSPSWTDVGEAAEIQFGFSVATAGDVNGDGYSDAIVGAWRFDPWFIPEGFKTSRGKAYVYLGSSVNSLNTMDSWTGTGEATGDGFGNSVATAGDVNGDGYLDVIVGAPADGSSPGKAYLYRGGQPTPSGLAANPSWIVTGEIAGDQFGWSAATAGDVNGDGYADVIVGAPAHGGSTGKAYLYLGGAPTPSGLAPSPSWTADGEAVGDQFGWSVATAGDVNGDGYLDVIVGAPAHNGSDGMAYVYLGGAPTSSGLPATASWDKIGAVDSEFGYSVATAGDSDGDGYADIIIGGPGANGSTGLVHWVRGTPGGPENLGAYFPGDSAGDRYGHSVATAGDVEGDGYSDYLVGAPGNNGSTGKVYLKRGRPAGGPVPAGWSPAGATAGNRFGSSVAAAGDVNRDGFSDVIVGALPDTTFTGEAYVYLGSAVGLASSRWSASSGLFADQYGGSVAAAGDVNGDGFSDVIVGAFGDTNVTGKAYLYSFGGGAGLSLLPTQLRADQLAPISLGGMAHGQQFHLGMTLRTLAVGRARVKLQWQIAPVGTSFDPATNPIQSDSVWYNTPEPVTRLVTLPVDQQHYTWRARTRYDPASSPFLLYGPWVTLSGNGLYEADILSTSQAPPACVGPVEELFITTVTLDGGGNPVLHYQDPNPSTRVTGYNVYRAAAPTGPWVLLDSNVVDMDAGAPDNQYVDLTGNIGGLWFYEVAAWSDVCGAEGP
jgi:hypothetical protein